MTSSPQWQQEQMLPSTHVKSFLYMCLICLLMIMTPLSYAATKSTPINHKERLSADKLFLQGKFDQSAKAYLKLYQGTSNPTKFDYLFLATKSLFATQKKAFIQQASESTNTLLAELETDHPLFYKSLLLRSMINYKLGNYSKALLQFEASLRYSQNKEGAFELGLCQLFQKAVENTEASNKCFEKLKTQFDQAYWAQKGIEINAKITGPDYKPQKATKEVAKPASIQSNPQAESDSPKVSTDATTNLYSIQVGAFGSKENAEFLKENLSILDKPIIILERTNSNGTLHLVRVQGFKTKSEAESYAQEKVAPQGLTYRVYKN